MRIARPFAWLCLWLVASQAAIDIISERWNYVQVNGVTQATRQITIRCDQEVIGTNVYEITITDNGDGKTPQRVYKLPIECSAPYWEYEEILEGYVALWKKLAALEVSSTLTPELNTLNATRVQLPPQQLQAIGDSTDQLVGDARTPLQKFNPSVVIGSGIGLGFDLGCIIPAFGNCGTPDLSGVIQGIQDQLVSFRQSFEEQNKVNTRFQEQFEYSIKLAEIQQRQQQRTDRAIESLQSQITATFSLTRDLAISQQEFGNSVKTSLQGLEAQQHQLAAVTLTLASQLENQTIQAGLATNRVTLSLQDGIAVQWQLYQNKPNKRAATQLFHDEISNIFAPAFVLPQNQVLKPVDREITQGVPFLMTEKGFYGSPPRKGGFTGLKNLAGSVVLAYGDIQMTSKTNGLAISIQTRYRCDQEFLLTNTVPGVSVATLLNRVGPAKCFDNRESWSCQCVITTKKVTAPIKSGGPIWPWGLTTDYLTLSDVPSGTFGTINQEADEKVYTSSNEFIQYLAEQMCQANSVLESSAVTLASKKPYQAKLMPLLVGGSWNITTGPQGTGAQTIEQCKKTFGYQANVPAGASHYPILQQENSCDTLNRMYFMWQQSYDNALRIVIPEKDKAVFGTLPYFGLMYESSSHCQDPTALRCDKMQFTTVSAKKEGQYFLATSGKFAGIRVSPPSVDGRLVPIELKAGEQAYNFPNRTAPHERLYSSVQYTVDGSDLMTDSMVRIGGFTYAGGDSAKNPEKATRYIYDIPETLIGVGQSPAVNMVNYPFEPAAAAGVTATSPLSAQVFFDRYGGVNYQPLAALEQAIFYRRQFETTGLCGPDFVYGRSPATSKTYNWCARYRKFDVQCSNRGGKRICKFTARKYSQIATIVVPAGTISTVVNSQCPALQTQRTPYGTVNAVLTSGRSAEGVAVTNQVTVQIRTIGGRSACDKMITVDLQPLVSTTVDVQECAGAKLELNVFTLDAPNTPCYSPWVDVSSVTNRTAGSLTPAQIEGLIDQRVRHIEDTITQAMVAQIEAITRYLSDLQRIQNMQITNRQELEDRVRKIIEDHVDDIGSLIIPDFSERAADVEKFINDETKKVADDIEANRQDSQTAAAELDRWRQKWNETWEPIHRLEELSKQQRANEARNNASIAEWNEYNRDHNSCSMSWLPFVGDAICGVANWFGGLFGNNIFSTIIKWILLLLFFVCIIYLCIQCIPMCMNASRSSSSVSERAQMTFNPSYAGRSFTIEQAKEMSALLKVVDSSNPAEAWKTAIPSAAAATIGKVASSKGKFSGRESRPLIAQGAGGRSKSVQR